MQHNTALESFLKPLYQIFESDNVTDIIINKPGEVWVEKSNQFTKQEVPELSFGHLEGLARLVAQSTSQTISSENPLLSATLPAGERIQIIFPPAVEKGTIGFAIRKPIEKVITLDEYEKFGGFENTAIEKIEDKNDKILADHLKKHEIKKFLEHAIISKKNIIISGGTSTGKTTLMNAALLNVPKHERLITVEDARETELPNHQNKLHLLVSKGSQGLAQVTTQSLIESCLRLRPDRIILGEIRGAEAFSFLRAINTGHPGSIATIHADTPNMAMEQLKLMVMQAGLGISQDSIKEYIKNVIDIILQIKKSREGKRFVSEIYFKYLNG